MNVVGTVDGTVAHVDTIEDSVVVAVEGAANTIDDDDAVDVQIIAYSIILGLEPASFDTVTSICLVGSSGILVGVGTAVTKIDRVGHKVTITIGAAEDGEPFLRARLPVSFRSGRVITCARSTFQLPSVGKDGATGIDGAVIEVVGHTIEVEIGTAMGRCEVMNRDVTIGSVGTGATIEAIRHAIKVGIKGLAGGRIVTRVGAARVADTPLGVLVDGHGSTDVVLVVPDAAGALIEDVGDAVLVCKNNNEKKQPYVY